MSQRLRIKIFPSSSENWARLTLSWHSNKNQVLGENVLQSSMWWQISEDIWMLDEICIQFVLSFAHTITYREREGGGGRRRRREKERERVRKLRLAISSWRHYGWNVYIPPKSVSWIPHPQCRGVWRWGLWEVMRFIWSQGGGAPRWDCCCQHCLFPPCEDTASRRSSANQEEGIHQKPDHAGTLISGFQPPELWHTNVCCLSHPVYGILL